MTNNLSIIASALIMSLPFLVIAFNALLVSTGDRVAMANVPSGMGVVTPLLLFASLVLLLLAVLADRHSSMA